MQRLNKVRLFLGVSAFAWSIGIGKYLGQTVTASGICTGNPCGYHVSQVLFPIWPNILDSIGMALIGVFLIYEGKKL